MEGFVFETDYSKRLVLDCHLALLLFYSSSVCSAYHSFLLPCVSPHLTTQYVVSEGDYRRRPSTFTRKRPSSAQCGSQIPEAPTIQSCRLLQKQLNISFQMKMRKMGRPVSYQELVNASTKNQRQISRSAIEMDVKMLSM